MRNFRWCGWPAGRRHVTCAGHGLLVTPAARPLSTRRLSAVVQALLTLRCSRFCGLVCNSRPLVAPAAHRLTHGVARLLSPVSLATLHPADLAPPASDPAAECEAVARFLQLSLGLLAPLAWQAATEASLFATHQRQRAAAGLPPEHGFDARLCEWRWGAWLLTRQAHRVRATPPSRCVLLWRPQPLPVPCCTADLAVRRTLHPVVRPHLTGLCLLMLGLCWAVAVGTAASGGDAAAAEAPG